MFSSIPFNKLPCCRSCKKPCKDNWKNCKRIKNQKKCRRSNNWRNCRKTCKKCWTWNLIHLCMEAFEFLQYSFELIQEIQKKSMKYKIFPLQKVWLLTFWLPALLQSYTYVAFFSCCSSWLFLLSLFVQFWLVQSPIGQLLSSAQFYSNQLNSAEFSWTKLNSAQFRSIPLNSAQFSSVKLSSAPVPFLPVLTCPIPHWTAGIFVCFRFIPNNSVQC